jgi:hypothetical protein
MTAASEMVAAAADFLMLSIVALDGPPGAPALRVPGGSDFPGIDDVVGGAGFTDFDPVVAVVVEGGAFGFVAVDAPGFAGGFNALDIFLFCKGKRGNTSIFFIFIKR